jgi:hypothetical protein
MPDETPSQPTTTGEGQQQQIQVQLVDHDVQAVYANSYRTFEMIDEVFVEFGYNMPHPHQQPGSPQVLLRMTHRVIMNRGMAKRLASTLTQMIKRFEQQFGEIPTQPQARR